MSQNTQPEPTHKGYRMQKFVEERSLPFMRQLNTYTRKPSAEEGNAVIDRYFSREDLEMLLDLSQHFLLLHDNIASRVD